MKTQLHKNFNPDLFNQNLLKLKLRLEKIILTGYERKTVEYFDFIAWIDSKLERKSFAEVMKKKYHVPLLS